MSCYETSPEFDALVAEGGLDRAEEIITAIMTLKVSNSVLQAAIKAGGMEGFDHIESRMTDAIKAAFWEMRQ